MLQIDITSIHDSSTLQNNKQYFYVKGMQLEPLALDKIGSMCFAVQNFFQILVGRRIPIELFQDYAPSVATTGPKESVPIMVETTI